MNKMAKPKPSQHFAKHFVIQCTFFFLIHLTRSNRIKHELLRKFGFDARIEACLFVEIDKANGKR